MFAAILKWLFDFPRRTWVVPTEEGQVVVMTRRAARAVHDAEKEYAAEGGHEVEQPYRWKWMRPSEVDALPEL